MDDHLDDGLRRKLIGRRGRLHAFDRPVPARTAVVVIDAVELFFQGLPGSAALIGPINRLTAAARRRGAPVAWVKPTPPATWRSAAASHALLGPREIERYGVELRPAGPGNRLHADLAVDDMDWQGGKRGHSAFFPGNCDLPDILRDRGIDTVLLAGMLTNICIEASARDAYEGGFRVLVCTDGVAANDEAQHRNSLRTLARVYADIRSADDLAALIGATPAGA